jgi:hypothetical protein
MLHRSRCAGFTNAFRGIKADALYTRSLALQTSYGAGGIIGMIRELSRQLSKALSYARLQNGDVAIDEATFRERGRLSTVCQVMFTRLIIRRAKVMPGSIAVEQHPSSTRSPT